MDFRFKQPNTIRRSQCLVNLWTFPRHTWICKSELIWINIGRKMLDFHSGLLKSNMIQNDKNYFLIHLFSHIIYNVHYKLSQEGSEAKILYLDAKTMLPSL